MILSTLHLPVLLPWWVAPSGARLAADIVNAHPDPAGLPGGNALAGLMDGLSYWALALALVGLLVGAAVWALGAHGQNYHQAYSGRRAVLISAGAALIIGAGPALVTFFFNTGQGVH